ncbi:MAG TPA: phosphoenolpyruvate carboxylase, partial [Acidimicrobiia bacterium]
MEPMTPDLRDERLRADIRRLGTQLGDALTRQHGPGLLQLVEQVRSLTKAVRTGGDRETDQALEAVLEGLDLDQTISLVRAFSAYFYLANVAEQTHRIGDLASLDEDNTFSATVERVLGAGLDPALVDRILSRLELRPVFTAHPTEATRRTLLTKLGRIADLLAERAEGRTTAADRRRIDRRAAEIIDQIWQTDELRAQRPQPIDEARSAVFYIDQLFTDVIPDLAEDVAIGLERLGVPFRSGASPIRFGTWVGGDRDGNPAVSPGVTMQVLEMQHEHGLRNLIEQVEAVAEEISTSTRIQAITMDLERSLEEDRHALSEVWQRFHTLNQDEPYRLKCAFVHQRLINTRKRIAEDARHVPGKDYESPAQLVDELEIMRNSLQENAGSLIADGVLMRLIRSVAVFGFHLATMDIREHASRHHEVVAQLYARLGVEY